VSTAAGAPLLAGYVAFDDTGLGFPTFSIVNLTGDPACDDSTGFVCDPGAFDNGVLRVVRNGTALTFNLPGPLEPQQSTNIEDSGWDFEGFESAQFQAILVPRSGPNANATPVIARLLPTAGQPGLMSGDLALIEVGTEIPEPATGWLVLGAAITGAYFRIRRKRLGESAVPRL
jgi:hypothetical protein